MAGSHIRSDFVLKSFCKDYRVKEDSRLSNFSLAEIFVGAIEHQVSDAEAKNIVGFLKHFASNGIVIIHIFSHSNKLRSLTGENKCFHNA